MPAGETIPLSDTDEDNNSDTESLDGIHRHENMHILLQAVAIYGVTPEVVEAAARMLKCSEGSSWQAMAVCLKLHSQGAVCLSLLTVYVGITFPAISCKQSMHPCNSHVSILRATKFATAWCFAGVCSL